MSQDSDDVSQAPSKTKRRQYERLGGTAPQPKPVVVDANSLLREIRRSQAQRSEPEPKSGLRLILSNGNLRTIIQAGIAIGLAFLAGDTILTKRAEVAPAPQVVTVDGKVVTLADVVTELRQLRQAISTPSAAQLQRDQRIEAALELVIRQRQRQRRDGNRSTPAQDPEPEGRLRTSAKPRDPRTAKDNHAFEGFPLRPDAVFNR